MAAEKIQFVAVLVAVAFCGCRKRTEAPVAEAAAVSARPSAVDDAAPVTADAGVAPGDGEPGISAPPGEDGATGAGTAAFPDGTVLLLSQSRFVDERQADGSTRPKPGPAVLVVLRRSEDGWVESLIEDPDSNVFHKAVVFDPAEEPIGVERFVAPRLPGEARGEAARSLAAGSPGILTIAAMGAYLKLWRPSGGGWSATTLWHPTFGGQFDRLRDMEIGDVTGDGSPEIVVATHDQGVVGVLRKTESGWTAIELDRRPGMFVHEVEIGDVDGDGRNEFFTTPSQPNIARAETQGGGIDRYAWNGERFERAEVMRSEGAHAKEILVADLDGDGRAALFASMESRTEAARDCRDLPGFEPMSIVRYDPEGAAFIARGVATLPDCMCRFLTWGDLDGDGKNEIVASAKNAGLFLIRLNEREAGVAELIDADSAGFEHATLVADLDRDGAAEIYVAADRQEELRRYVWNPGLRSFDRAAIYHLGSDQITWNVGAGFLPR